MRTIGGKEAADFIEQRISRAQDNVADYLRDLEPQSALDAWFETYRAIEEFINLPLFALDDEALEARIISFRIDTFELDLRALSDIHQKLLVRLDEDVVRRYLLTITQMASLALAARQHGLPYASAVRTIGDAIGYFQSRRRHFVALLYTIPAACRGSIRVDRLDTLNVFVPMIELTAIPLTGLYLQRMLSEVFQDYEILIEDGLGFRSNHQYQTLDRLFLDSERMSLDDMYQSRYDENLARDLEPTDPKKVFSPAELRNNLRLIEAGFAEFDLTGTDFGRFAEIVPSLLEHCNDHFRIEMTVQEFDRILSASSAADTLRALLLHNESSDFVDNTNQFAPFMFTQGKCLSSVTLLTRFFNHLKSRCLESTRRFQVHSGFVFEDLVKAELANQGFSITNIKRINRREFDVIALLNGVVFNVQCKNNRLDLTQFERHRKRFARHNRRLDRYYAKALRMEEAREHLLQQRFNVKEVRHALVSRFPVATSNPRIIAFAELDEFKERFAEQSNL